MTLLDRLAGHLTQGVHMKLQVQLILEDFRIKIRQVLQGEILKTGIRERCILRICSPVAVDVLVITYQLLHPDRKRDVRLFRSSQLRQPLRSPLHPRRLSVCVFRPHRHLIITDLLGFWLPPQPVRRPFIILRLLDLLPRSIDRHGLRRCRQG